MSMQGKGRAIAVAVLVFILTLVLLPAQQPTKQGPKPLYQPMSVVAVERNVQENIQKREAVATLDQRLTALTIRVKKAEQRKAKTEKQIQAKQTEAQRLAEKAARLHNEIARLEKQLSRLRQRLAVQRAAAAARRRAATTPGPYTVAAVKAYARARVGDSQFQCLNTLWNNESGWNWRADNPTSDAYGIPQALPGSKMASAGADWATNPYTQVRWGLGYIQQRYGTPCAALAFWNSHYPHWY